MSIDFAQINLYGRLTADPELRTSDKGNSICKFDIAVNKRLSNGEEKTSFIPITVFGKQGQVCAEYLTKGRSVLIIGDFETDKYTDKSGNSRTGFGVIAQQVKFGNDGKKDDDEVNFDDLPPDAKRAAARNYIKGGRGR